MIGVFGMTDAAHYRLGSATHMGPGYFPFVVSAIIALLGLASAVTRCGARAGSGRWCGR